jgi:hypothetical protein
MLAGLLFNSGERDRIREKIENHAWARNAARCLKRQADEVFASDRPTRASLGAIESAAIHFSITEDDQHLKQSELLLNACKDFSELFGTVSASTFDFGCNSLYTGHRLPHLCIVLDLLWDALSESTRDHVADNLIRPAVDHLRSNDRRDSNWQTAHSTGLLAAGLVLADEKVSDFALNDPDHGLIRHMTCSFLSDGLHWEGSFGYHWGTLRNLLLAAEIVRHTGLDLFSEGEETPHIKRMFDVPIQMAFPDGSLPINNDAGHTTLDHFHQEYELAYARYRDPAYGWVLRNSDRTSLYALLYGELEVKSEPPDSHSLTLGQTGWTSLKHVEGKAYWDSEGMAVILDHGPHGDWHGHPDKLGIELFAKGLKWIQNEGSPVGYHGQQHWEYFRKTLAHNSVVVDFEDQHFVRAGDDVFTDLEHTGKVTECVLTGEEKRVTAEVDWAYQGVTYTRTLSLKSGLLTDAFDLTSSEEHTYDYVLHGRGFLEAVDAEMEPARLPQTRGGYEYFTNTSRLKSGERQVFEFQDGGWPDGRFVPTGSKLLVDVEGARNTEFWTGYAPSRLSGVRMPFLLVRRCVESTTFHLTFDVE